MTQATAPRWHPMRTDQSRFVEETLGPHFDRVDAYQYTLASVRVRIVDRRFAGRRFEERDDLVEPILTDRLPEAIRGEIINLLLIPPEFDTLSPRDRMANLEFDDPSPTLFDPPASTDDLEIS